MSTRAYKISVHFDQGIHPSKLKDEINANVNIGPECLGISVSGDDVIISFDAALDSNEVIELDNVTIEGHDNTPPIVIESYSAITANKHIEDVTQDATWELVASLFSRPEAIVSDLARSYVYVLGLYECDATGGTPQFRIMANAPGGGAEVELVAPTAIADTAGTDAVFAAFTPKNLLSGYARYKIEARLNGGTSLKMMDLVITPLEDITPT